jgi:hypothetical protein
MSRAGVMALVDDWTFGLATQTTLGSYYEDLTWDATRWGVPTTAVLLPVVRGTSEYVMPDAEGRTYAIFYDDILLSKATLRELEAVNARWRDKVGRPISWVEQDTPDHTFRITPTPEENSQDFIFLFGSPFGHDFPFRAVAAIIGERRDDLPDWLDVPLALSVLGREYERDSDHRDPQFALACRTIGTSLLALVLA